MIILGIETSCDETAAAVLTNDHNRVTILSNVVASSANLQSKYGGIIPEQAAREQLKSIIPVIKEAINDSRLTINDIDAIAVTYGPGLIGSLLVGVETAKVLSLTWNKPLIPINHLLGHFYANWINEGTSSIMSQVSGSKNMTHDPLMHNTPKFPCLGLLVSGGHTDLVLFTDHGKYKYLGGTRDDAAGECFDKCARLLGLPYPGGPEISKLAKLGNSKNFPLPIPMKNSKGFDFSYSGLKTSVSNIVHSLSKKNNSQLSIKDKRDLAASIENTVVESLINKIMLALEIYPVKDILVSGGVASNQKLATDLKLKIENLKLKIKLHVPPPYLCTDNAAMIASAAFFIKEYADSQSLQADPNLALG